ncbi:alcohol dehydrogenase catalytic domain-containing protein [Neorhizobium sp. IRAMC:178]|uniref:alcohol dehydrogenase catalytic domain-containing protein n=1 Tax=Neorhizobium tunisiense TaxID=3144793 RepID=UPI0031F6C72D
MKAIELRAFDGPETLICEEIALPARGQGEVLVKIACCGVRHLDLILRSGMRSRVSLPRVLGHELAGEVVATGLGVNGFAAGDGVTVFNFQACGECADCLRVLDFMHANGIKPEIWRRMPLSEAAEAHRQLHKRGAVGRILLVP